MSCQCPTPSNLPEQAEFNCLPSHLGSFCPPECKKCNPCMGLNYCDCPQLPDCEGCKVDPYCTSYQRIKYVQSCNLQIPKSCSPPCDLTPPRRESFKPIYICKTQTVPTHYETIYRRSYDVPNYNPPPY